MKLHSYTKSGHAAISASAFLMLLPVLAAHAGEIEQDNPDLKIRFDNTIRYNLGVRTKKQDPAIMNTYTYANSDLKFDRGDIITNRVDLLSEFDVVYKKNHGLRVSAQGWYDAAYDRNEITNPALPGSSAYPNQRFTNYAKRWNQGPSGEILDAFVFTNFDIGDISTNVKVGSHNLYWGESLFSFVHGVSYSQGPVDIRKALATPGVEAKELFKPLNQISFGSQLTPTLSVAGQYFLDWKPSTLPDGGTYWGALDFVSMGGGTVLPNGLPFAGINHKPDNKRGDWGLMTRWSPAWLDGSLGAYYREYTDKLPLFALASDFSNLGLDYQSKRATLVGVSMSKSIGGIAFGSEISHRRNGALLMGPMTTVGTEPVGDTWHALVNALGYAGKTPLFDSMVWMTELTYSRLDKLRSNGANFNSVDYGCRALVNQLSCATKDAYGIAIKIEPKWFQVVEGADLSMPIFYTTGLKGTSPVLFGGYKGSGSYSLGLNLDYQNKYLVSLAYNGVMTKRTIVGNTVMDVGGIGAQWDRNNVTLTLKATF